MTYQEGDEVAFTVTAKEKYAIRTASAFIALSGEEAAEVGDTIGEDVTPILITQDKVEVSRTDSVVEDGETVR